MRIIYGSTYLNVILQKQIEWLGLKFSQSGIAPLESKTAAIASLSAPKNLKQLRSFLGSVHYL